MPIATGPRIGRYLGVAANYIEIWLERVVRKDTKYKSSASTAIWDDSFMGVIKKYVHTR